MYDKAVGTDIKWKEDKDLTKKIEIKKQRNKTSGRTRVVRKSVPTESFFNFFKPPQPPSREELEEGDVDEEELEELDGRLEIDYQLGEDFKEKIIPRAVDYFTGKALRYEDDFEEDFEDDDEDYEDDDDDEVGRPARTAEDIELTCNRRVPLPAPRARTASSSRESRCFPEMLPAIDSEQRRSPTGTQAVRHSASSGCSKVVIDGSDSEQHPRRQGGPWRAEAAARRGKRR